MMFIQVYCGSIKMIGVNDQWLAITSLQFQLLTFAAMTGLPGCQLAGQTSPPCSSVYLQALTRRTYSSGFLPTGKSSTLEWRTMPLGSMMQVARQATPSSPTSQRQSQARAIFLFTSAIMGMSMGPNPPFFLSLSVYSMWVNLESIDTASTSQFNSANYFTLELKAMISVGHTKVKSRGQKNRSTYLPRQSCRSISLKSFLNHEAALKCGAGLRSRGIQYTNHSIFLHFYISLT